MYNLGISVYTGLKDYTKEENVKYLQKAKDIGFTHVFSSAHITEALNLQDEINDLIETCEKLGLKLSLDISKPQFDNLKLSKNIYALRLDYGFSDEEIIALSNNLDFRIELNASCLSKERLKKLLEDGLNPSNVTLCFNFYPKKWTGHDYLFVHELTKEYHELGFLVACFVPSHVGFRPPLYEGLPTIEMHRIMKLEDAIEELKALKMDTIYFGDAYASVEELFVLKEHNTSDLWVKAKTYQDISLFNITMKRRIDSPSWMLRLPKLKTANEILPYNNIERKKYDITVDNIKFARYAGEVNLILNDEVEKGYKLGQDIRVNVVGKINTSEHVLDAIALGAPFRFVKE